MMDVEIQTAGATRGEWRRVATSQTMHDGATLRTWGVQVAGTLQWIGKAHPISGEPEGQAEAFVNAGLFAASKAMAVLLEESVEAWAAQFDDTGNDDGEISGGDLLEWFAGWRLRVKAALQMRKSS